MPSGSLRCDYVGRIQQLDDRFHLTYIAVAIFKKNVIAGIILAALAPIQHKKNIKLQFSTKGLLHRFDSFPNSLLNLRRELQWR